MKMVRDIDCERGIALVLSLFLMMTMSVLAASLLFLAQTETYASMNYRLMSQARYGAESGVHKTVNYLLNSYTRPGTVNDPLSNYDMTTLPVLYNGQPVILSGISAVPANYPIASVQTAFNEAAHGTLTAGARPVSYAASAKLLSMLVTGGETVMSWEITSDGTVSGARPATVEVTSVLEKQLTPQISTVYAAFAKANTCGALSLASATTDSYDSTAALGGNGKPVIANNSGNLGTNGNLTENNSSQVHGTLSTPRVGVGNCSSGNVTAETISGGATIDGGIIHLSQEVVPPTPDPPSPAPDPTQTINLSGGACPGGLPAGACTKSGADYTLQPIGGCGGCGVYGNLTSSNNSPKIHLKAGTYNFNSVYITGGGSLVLDSGPVVISLQGTGSTIPFRLNSAIERNAGVGAYDPTQFQIKYAGAQEIRFENSAVAIGQVDAPNALVNIQSSDFYGTLMGNKVTMGNSGKLHFDRHLASGGALTYVVGQDMLTSFTWKKY